MSNPGGEVTNLLHEWSQGDGKAVDSLIPLVYFELRRIALRNLRNERQGHSLSPTEVVHETFLALNRDRKTQMTTWSGRQQFYSIVAITMRRILITHARRHLAEKRGGGGERLSLDTGLDTKGAIPSALVDLSADHFETVLNIDSALDRFKKIDKRACEIVHYRFYIGMSLQEIANALSLSTATVKRDLQIAKIWLARELESNSKETAP